MARFRKKPVEIDAVRYIGNGNVENADVPDWMWGALRAGTITHTATSKPLRLGPLDDAGEMQIKTLEGVMIVSPGDWIVRGVKGGLYPCKPDVFEATYEPANTRPQPAQPEGEPDFDTIAERLQRGNTMGDLGRTEIADELRDAYRLGLAARTKIEDADTENFGPGSWRRLLAQLRETKAKLAEREAELAKTDAVIYSLWEMDATINARYSQNVMRAELENARERHVARQQQKDAK